MFNHNVRHWVYLILGGVSYFYMINFVAFYFFLSLYFVKSKTGLC